MYKWPHINARLCIQILIFYYWHYYFIIRIFSVISNRILLPNTFQRKSNMSYSKVKHFQEAIRKKVQIEKKKKKQYLYLTSVNGTKNVNDLSYFSAFFHTLVRPCPNINKNAQKFCKSRYLSTSWRTNIYLCVTLTSVCEWQHFEIRCEISFL